MLRRFLITFLVEDFGVPGGKSFSFWAKLFILLTHDHAVVELDQRGGSIVHSLNTCDHAVVELD